MLCVFDGRRNIVRLNEIATLTAKNMYLKETSKIDRLSKTC